MDGVPAALWINGLQAVRETGSWQPSRVALYNCFISFALLPSHPGG